ncbi:long-chain fatty acid--CoA ligase [Mycolicibacterium moriokaense]|uniref:Acyl-CoA synthetase n=1 Tax=Mycolicibacterium moriokaense TaxID=39691 RepID=A0AAD1HA30_9MYCO|nr:long-chain fatty acid--CoA ligase [Mycolicibacterium moriokaense]MCV7039179.1 long-chain fatty acid--CoA ligase [Mycolicibacterium moriokaense]ORB18538.1 long-chain fatty acid--CoA ligase [Mycolicibacterium moriokaense]BBX00083.1 putative fatty-acid-CoA ligase FadD [Mycolicibacterium moriokaense]
MSQAIHERSDLDEPIHADTVAAAFQRTVARHPDRIALRTADGASELTWSQFNDRARRAAAGMAALGIGKGHTVAMMLPNTIDCHVLDIAAVHLGAVPFAIFNSSPAEQIEYQLRQADATLVVTQESFLPRVKEASAALGNQIRHIVVTDDIVAEGVLSLKELENSGSSDFDFDAVWPTITADDLVTLIYTSGTTGPPKAAQWSHRTVMSQLRALDAAVPLPREAVISFLPLAHAGGRITSHYMALPYGAAITTCPDLTQLAPTLARVHPDAFFSVPRFWEKIQVAIETAIANQPSEIREELERAVEIGRRHTAASDAGSSASTTELADLDAAYESATLLLRPILAQLGLDRIKSAFVGGAPAAPELSQFFRAVGVPMLEAYGLTEGSLNIFNQVERFKSGTAGIPLPGVEVKLADDGELLVRSDLNFVGYRHLPEVTAQTLDADGWLHTGDIAEIDADGYVSIVDRKKEIIINAAGKNMSPATIESAIKGESSLIGQIVSIGDGRRYVTALITLDPEALAHWGRQLGLVDRPIAEVVSAPQIQDEIAAAVERGNRRLNSNEQIKKYTVLPTFWLPDSDELTPTAKVKRRAVIEKYALQIEEMYA